MKTSCSIDRLIQITREQWREKSAAGDDFDGPGSASQPLVVERRAANGGLQSAHASHGYPSDVTGDADLWRSDDGHMAAA